MAQRSHPAAAGFGPAEASGMQTAQMTGCGGQGKARPYGGGEDAGLPGKEHGTQKARKPGATRKISNLGDLRGPLAVI